MVHMGSRSNDRCPSKRHTQEGHREEEEAMGRLDGCSHKPGNADSHQEVEEARRESSPESLGRTWPCCYLNFRLVVSRTVKKCISAVLSHAVEKAGHSELVSRMLEEHDSCFQSKLSKASVRVVSSAQTIRLPLLSDTFPSQFYSNVTSSEKPFIGKPGFDILPCASVTNSNCLPLCIVHCNLLI